MFGSPKTSELSHGSLMVKVVFRTGYGTVVIGMKFGLAEGGGTLADSMGSGKIQWDNDFKTDVRL